jgi:Tol biopolymer transport system component
MTLQSGVRVGGYEVVALVGAGGMGEVYRARDTRLGRDVALKVLADAVGSDPDRLARLHREAQVLAALNHSNIAHIYGLEESDGRRALVLEFVEGPTLAERIARGPIALDEAIPIARQIVDALESAHEQGIVHRDLKPANVKLRPDGTVKVLDFGLAKAINDEGALAAASGLSRSPTITTPAMTLAGVVLGTAAYMAPEQAKGRPVDKRSDVWAFGCVLYEMLSGHRTFDGDDVADTLAFVLTKEPDWSVLPPDTPDPIRKLLRRCLQKDRRRRLADISDARIEIDEAIDAPAAEAGTVARRQRLAASVRVAWTITGIALFALGATALGLWPRPTPADPPVVRFTVTPPEGWTLASGLNRYGADNAPVAVSPDGRFVALLARNAGGQVRLWVRSLDALAARELPDTDGATGPFWSPDSRFVGFFADGKLKKIDVAGGSAITLCNAQSFNGASWGRGGFILFAQAGVTGGPILKVSASGGEPAPATRLEKTETFHLRPSFLPDGRHFFYRAASSSLGAIYLASLESPERTVTIAAPDASNVTYANGYLLHLRDTTLMAQPFDLGRLRPTGEPTPVAEQVHTLTNYAMYSASDAGVLAYAAGVGVGGLQLAWLDRSGTTQAAVQQRDSYNDVTLSPDGTQATVSIGSRDQSRFGARDVWLVDLLHGRPSRFTFDPARAFESVWSPDGTRIVFNSSRNGHLDLFVKASSGAGNEELLFADPQDKHPTTWSPDGRYLLYSTSENGGGVWVLPMTGDRKPYRFIHTPANESQAHFSPDGRWVAYSSNESGTSRVYVAPFPGPGGKKQVSSQRGSEPRWRPDGKELFYLASDNVLTAVEVDASTDAVRLGAEHALFTLPPSVPRSPYDVAPDGRFLATTLVQDSSSTTSSVTILVNWPLLLKK